MPENRSEPQVKSFAPPTPGFDLTDPWWRNVTIEPQSETCGAVWTDANGYAHTCDRRPHTDEHLHAENSGE